MLWHPHQGLWNGELLRAIRRIVPLSPIYKLIAGLIVLLDTAILILRAVVRRVSRVGATRILSNIRVPHDISILYFDLGTYKEARELALMIDGILPRLCDKFESYGFEASPESFQQAKVKFADRENVNLINKALCYVLPPNGKIKLYKNMKGGSGDSLYRHSEHYQEVEAVRLSCWLSENNIDLQNSICLLRMNIEGAEYDILKDLVESRLAKHIDGYYGMWDDISKIDKQRDGEFRAFLSENQIHPFTFNGRDLKWPIRMRCIEYDINTSVQAGLHELREGLKGNVRCTSTVIT